MTVHDTSAVEIEDLGAQFYLSESDVGKNRATACKDKLQELNPAVTVSASTGDITEAMLKTFQVVVCTGMLLDEAKRIDEFCHAQTPAIPFIKADINGLFASVFCDFGPSFMVLDVDGKCCDLYHHITHYYCLLFLFQLIWGCAYLAGEDPHQGIVASVTSGSPALITCIDDERLEFQTGDMVIFTEVEGMTELNGGKPRKIKNCKVKPLWHAFVTFFFCSLWATLLLFS